jgi:hypothetical protein
MSRLFGIDAAPQIIEHVHSGLPCRVERQPVHGTKRYPSHPAAEQIALRNRPFLVGLDHYTERRSRETRLPSALAVGRRDEVLAAWQWRAASG